MASTPAASQPLSRTRSGRLLAGYVLLFLLSTLPVWATSMPPLHDYPFHLARMLVLAGPEQWSEYYEVGSFLLPNIGMDVVVQVLTPLVGVFAAGWMFVLMALATMFSGVIVLARTLGVGDRATPALAAGFLLINAVLYFGFLNYLLGLGAMLWATAGWLWLREARPRLALAFLGAMAGLLFFCHLAAFGVFALTIVGVEALHLRPTWHRRPRRAAARIALVALAVLAPLAILPLSPTAGDLLVVEYRSLRWKLVSAVATATTHDRHIDIAAYAAVAVLGGLAALAGRPRLSRAVMPALALLAIAFAVLPHGIGKTAYVDYRLPIAFCLLLAAALSVEFRRPALRTLFVAGMVTLIGARGAAVAANWRAYEAYNAELIGLFRSLPEDSAVLALSPPIYEHVWGAYWEPPTYKVSATLAMLTGRRIFVPAVWASPQQQPIRVRPKWEELYRFQSANPIVVETRAEIEERLARLCALTGKGDVGAPEPRLYVLVQHAPVLEERGTDLALLPRATLAGGERSARSRLYRIDCAEA